MPVDLDHKLVIGVASSALFDTTESHAVWTDQGEDAYRQYQRQHEQVPLLPGPAFGFIKGLLQLNDPELGFHPVEVVLLSRNTADTGLRVMNSIEHHALPITRAFFRGGRPPFIFMQPTKAVLYLSANRDDVDEAIAAGFPAGQIMGTAMIDDGMNTNELRIAFDFDGILVDDSAEQVFQKKGLDAFHAHEKTKTPLPIGPLHPLLKKIASIQAEERKRKAGDSKYKCKLRTAICTARNAPSHSRAIHTLRDWGIDVDEVFFLGGIDKADVLKEFKPHIFFDDQETWVASASDVVPSVHVPFGEINARLSEVLQEEA